MGGDIGGGPWREWQGPRHSVMPAQPYASGGPLTEQERVDAAIAEIGVVLRDMGPGEVVEVVRLEPEPFAPVFMLRTRPG